MCGAGADKIGFDWHYFLHCPLPFYFVYALCRIDFEKWRFFYAVLPMHVLPTGIGILSHDFAVHIPAMLIVVNG